MENACFRCKTPIESGRTFCGDCRRAIARKEQDEEEDDFQSAFGDPDATGAADDGPGRNWSLTGVAVVPVVWLGLLAVTALPLLLVSGRAAMVVGISLSLFTPVLVPVFAYALLKDAEHVRNRADADWSPSRVGYWGLVPLLLLTLGVTMPVVAAYHLYRRHASTGLAWTHDEAA